MKSNNQRENNSLSSKKQEFPFTPQPVPRDPTDERYTQAFTLQQIPQILAFWKEYGVVVIRDVLAPAECQATIDQIIHLLSVGSNRKFKRDDASTWENWPSDGMSKYGQPTHTPIFNEQFLKNRQNENIFKAFSVVLNSEDLLVSHDRACFFRPTKNVQFPDGTVKDMPHWKTAYGIHLDINPYHWMQEDAKDCISKWDALSYGNRLNHFISENNIGHKSAVHVQGVLNLADNYEEDGGFVCVPGFIHHYDNWYEANKRVLANITTSPSVSFTKDHWLNKHIQRICMRPGSLVIWDSRTPHGSFPNNSSRPRCVQFIKMFLKTDILSQRALMQRAQTLEREIQIVRFENKITPLGAQLFGLPHYAKNVPQKINEPPQVEGNVGQQGNVGQENRAEPENRQETENGEEPERGEDNGEGDNGEGENGGRNGGGRGGNNSRGGRSGNNRRGRGGRGGSRIQGNRW